MEVEIDVRERGAGETPFIESARAGAEGYPPNIRNPKGEATFTRCFPKA